MPHFHGFTQLFAIALFVWIITWSFRMIALSHPNNRLSKAFLAANG